MTKKNTQKTTSILILQIQVKNDRTKGVVSYVNLLDACSAMNDPNPVLGNVLIKKSFKFPEGIQNKKIPSSTVTSVYEPPKKKLAVSKIPDPTIVMDNEITTKQIQIEPPQDSNVIEVEKDDDSFLFLDNSNLAHDDTEKENQPITKKNNIVAIKENLRTKRVGLVETTNFTQVNNDVANKFENKISEDELLIRHQHLWARELDNDKESRKQRHEEKMELLQLMKLKMMNQRQFE